MLTCTKEYRDIPFAHRQYQHDGHCAQIHGHNWGVTIAFQAKETDRNGFVIDFGKLSAIKDYFKTFDHACVFCDADPFIKTPEYEAMQRNKIINPVWVADASCEGLAAKFFHDIDVIVYGMTDGRVTVKSITVHEDEKNSATFTA